MKNQCDGCARGLPLAGNIHHLNGHPVQCCIKHLFEEVDHGPASEKAHPLVPEGTV